MILKPHHDAPAGFLPECKAVIIDHPHIGALRVEVHRAQILAFHALVRLIVMSQHLIPAADGEKRFPVLDGGADLPALSASQIGKEHLLFKILPSADEEQIEFGQIRLIADLQHRHMAVNAAPRKPLLQTADIAAVSI